MIYVKTDILLYESDSLLNETNYILKYNNINTCY